jgi:hypothetical protein
VNFAERDFNRKLSVEKILEKLERWMPEQFKLAEIVGKWIWRGTPIWWHFVDCSFGVFGFVPVWLCKKWFGELHSANQQVYQSPVPPIH